MGHAGQIGKPKNAGLKSDIPEQLPKLPFSESEREQAEMFHHNGSAKP